MGDSVRPSRSLVEIGRLDHHIKVEGQPVTKPIKYACDDGFAVRFRGYEAWACYADGQWREISAAEAVCKHALLTERAYWDMFGPTSRRPVPPLPDHAFCDGWRSPLV